MASPDVTKIHYGAGDIFVGGTPPAAGTNPNDPTAGTPSALVAATTGYAGVTTTGTYVGYTNGPATFTYRPTYYQVVTEQAFAEVLVTPTAEECTLVFNVQQLTYNNIKTAFGQSVTLVAGGASTNFGGGRGTITPVPVVLISKKRTTGPGYYAVCIYQGYSDQGAAVNFERRAETRLPVTIRGLADATRPVGDQLFQLTDYATDPA